MVVVSSITAMQNPRARVSHTKGVNGYPDDGRRGEAGGGDSGRTNSQKLTKPHQQYQHLHSVSNAIDWNSAVRRSSLDHSWDVSISSSSKPSRASTGIPLNGLNSVSSHPQSPHRVRKVGRAENGYRSEFRNNGPTPSAKSHPFYIHPRQQQQQQQEDEEEDGEREVEEDNNLIERQHQHYPPAWNDQLTTHSNPEHNQVSPPCELPTHYANTSFIDAGLHNAPRTPTQAVGRKPQTSYHQMDSSKPISTRTLPEPCHHILPNGYVHDNSNSRDYHHPQRTPSSHPQASTSNPLYRGHSFPPSQSQNGDSGTSSPSPRTRENSFSTGQNHQNPAVGILKNSVGANFISSLSPTSRHSSVTSLNTWSPSYVTLNFKSEGVHDPIHHPVPRDSTGLPRRSKSSGQFTNLPNSSSSSSCLSNSFYAKNERGVAECGTRGVGPEAGVVPDTSAVHDIAEYRISSASLDRRRRSSQHSRSVDCPDSCWTDSWYSIASSGASGEITYPPRAPSRNHRSGRFSADQSGCSSSNNVSPANAVSPPAYVTLPRRNSEQHLRRTVSHEPRGGIEPKPFVPRTSSDGEIESEYVTLDRRYVPVSSSRLCRVAEVTITPPPLPVTNIDTPGLYGPEHSRRPSPHNDNASTDSTGSMSQVATTTHVSNAVTNPYPVDNNNTNHSPANLVTSSSSMQHLTTTTNPTSESKRSNWRKKHNSGTLRTVAETLGSVFSPLKGGSSRSSGSPRSTGSLRDTPTFDTIVASNTSSLRRNSVGRRQPSTERNSKLTRSKSLPDLQVDESATSENFSDDEDGDDFGFLSYPISFSSSCSSAAMHKAKSPSPGSRIIPKRWRTKGKAIPAVTSSAAMWTPGPVGSCSWSSVSGRKVQLRPVSILQLSEAERVVLQKIALSKLQGMDLACPVSTPKDSPDERRGKKSSLSLKRRSKSVSASALDTVGRADGSAPGLVFGIPLSKCVMNDRELEKKRRRMAVAAASNSVRIRSEGNDMAASRPLRKSSSSSQGSVDNNISSHNGTVTSHQADPLTVPSHKRAASSDSLSESESSRNTSSSLIDALTLPTSNSVSRLGSVATDSSQLANQGEAQVPYVVKACFRHIQTYGLQTLGIFRVGCSKKRVKQLREEFDSGKEVQLTEEHHPHDVGALLKEYFRDLPKPLLSRELYLPFLHAKRLTDEQTRHMAMRLLIAMLEVANRDTLWSLLRFLATVSQHAADTIDEKGEVISGNKMDVHNLATLFGPNILHCSKPVNGKDLMAESAETVEQSKEVIEVVKDMIDNHHDLFEISGSLRDDILRLLIESDQETADKILKMLANQNQIEADPESMCSVFEDSSNCQMLGHSSSSDADLLLFSRRHTSTSHRPLRVTKSADDNLDSPVSKSRATHSSESQALSPSSRDNQRFCSSQLPLSNQTKFDLGHNFPSPLPARVPTLKVSQDSSTPEVVLRGRLETSGLERPYSEGFQQSLNIPRPLYLRENSSSSVSSGLSSSLNSHGGSDNSPSGHWVLPTPPGSRGTSPKPFFRSASSSSTLTASPSPNRLQHPVSHNDNFENTPPVGSAEWERERWQHWEKIAAEKKNSENDQETLV